MVIFLLVGVGVCVGIIKGMFEGIFVGLKSVDFICYVGGGIIIKVVDLWIMCIVVIVVFYVFGVFIFLVFLLGIGICIGGFDKFVCYNLLIFFIVGFVLLVMWCDILVVFVLLDLFLFLDF